MRRISQCGIGLGDCQSESKRIRLTEIVERMLSARDVGGVPPPIARGSRLYAGGSAQLLAAGRSKG